MYSRLLACLLGITIAAPLSASVKSQAEHDIKKKKYDHLGKLLKKEVGDGITLTEVKALAKKNNAKPVLNAIEATRKIKKYHTNIKLKRPELMQTALFIETSLPKEVKKGKYFLSKQRTGLKHSVEHDKKHNTSFIVLDGKDNYIGQGKKKVVHKAIHYNHRHPKVVARAVDCTTNGRENYLTRKLHGSTGVFKTVGFGKNQKNGKEYRTIYSKLYRPGSLQDAMDKKYKLSTYEKMLVASMILDGLYSLHGNGIVHRDLGARNYLIDIPRGKPGKRNVTAAIADLGRANYAKYAADTKVQGNTTYTAPEGLYRNKLRGKDYYKTDIFAVGCVFYRLFYEKKAPWQDASYVKDVDRSLYGRYVELRHKIKKATKKRRTYLANKRTLSPKEDFEYLILRMLHTDQTKRGTAKQLSSKMHKILNRAK